MTFPGAEGAELTGRLELPVGRPRAHVLFAHCFTCGKDLAAARRISARLVAEGFAVLRFDFTGLGESGGDLAATGFTSNVGDLVAAADAMRRRWEAPSLLVGHSLGGAAVLAAAGRIPETEGVVTIGAPSDPAHVRGLFTEEDLAAIDREGAAEITLAGRRLRIGRRLLAEIEAASIDDAVRSLGRPLLVLHAPGDEIVDISHAHRIFDLAAHPKSLVALDAADHLLSDRSDAEWAATVIAAWASRYVPDRHAGERPPEGEVVVESAGGRFTQLIRAGAHTLVADEPPGVGDDLGPSPYDLLLAALGACTSMTLRMYADRKGIPLEHVRVVLRHERTHADDCVDADGRPCRVELIDRLVEVTGDLDGPTRTRLLEIADRCPVHRTLTGDLRISTELAG